MIRASIESRWHRAPSAYAFAALAALAATTAVAQAPASRDGIIARWADSIARDVARDGVGAITAGVVIGDRVVWKRGFGYADAIRRTAADENTVYRIGSITKSFTAVVLAQLAERGSVTLDDSVARWLPEINGLADRRPNTKAITLRQLASHTAGIIREPRLQGAATGPFERWETRILESIPTTAFDTVPGARYQYSNIGFGILGYTLSRAADRPFVDLVATGILQPLGMTSSGFVATPAIRTHLSVGYTNGPGEPPDTVAPAREHAGRGYKVPNGGLYSTAEDLGRFMIAMWGATPRQILSPASRTEMMKLQTPGNPRSGYGLGFQIAVGEDGRRIVSHGGSVAGYTAHIAFDPEAKIGVVLLRNYAGGAVNLGGRANALLRELRDARPSEP
jgi:CubicO group peptidase (beta-lactamase class C family)